MTTQEIKTFGQLSSGTVVNFYRPTTADDTNFVVLYHYEDRWGKWTECLNMQTLEKENFTSHTEIKHFWNIVKEH